MFITVAALLLQKKRARSSWTHGENDLVPWAIRLSMVATRLASPRQSIATALWQATAAQTRQAVTVWLRPEAWTKRWKKLRAVLSSSAAVRWKLPKRSTCNSATEAYYSDPLRGNKLLGVGVAVNKLLRAGDGLVAISGAVNDGHLRIASRYSLGDDLNRWLNLRLKCAASLKPDPNAISVMV